MIRNTGNKYWFPPLSVCETTDNDLLELLDLIEAELYKRGLLNDNT